MQRTQIRVPDNIYDKSTVLAAIYKVSFNQFVVDLLAKEVNLWEAAHGEIPTLESKVREERH